MAKKVCTDDDGSSTRHELLETVQQELASVSLFYGSVFKQDTPKM